MSHATEEFHNHLRDLYAPNAGHAATRSSLVIAIETLEDRARRLESGWGEMLAMMRLERNRENIRKGDPEIIDELFRLVDQFKARFDAAKAV